LPHFWDVFSPGSVTDKVRPWPLLTTDNWVNTLVTDGHLVIVGGAFSRAG
jgi:hypothetical protein